MLHLLLIGANKASTPDLRHVKKVLPNNQKHRSQLQAQHFTPSIYRQKATTLVLNATPLLVTHYDDKEWRLLQEILYVRDDLCYFVTIYGKMNWPA